MDASYDSYRYAFESCKSYKDGAVSPNDFARICSRYKLNYKVVMEQVNTDGEGRFPLDAFIHYLKRFQHQFAHPPSTHQSYNHDPGIYTRPTSPPHSHRPSSASKLARQGVHQSSGSHHYSRHSSRYPVSPTAREGGGPYDNEELISEDPQIRRTKTPDNFLSPEEKMAMRHERDRLRLDQHYSYDHHSTTSRSRMGTHSRGTVDTPPPTVTNHHSRSRYRGDMVAGRSDKARSFKGGDSDEEEGNIDPYVTPISNSRPNYNRSKHPLDQIHDSGGKSRRSDRDRSDQGVERLRKDNHVDLNSDLAYAQLICENEKLRQKLLRKENVEPDTDRTISDRQIEELKKVKVELEEELFREKSSHKAYKKECHALKAEYNILRLKNEELQRANWRLQDDNQKLHVKVMDDDRSSSFSRRPGDGGSEEHSARSSYASDLAFQRSALRQTYHGGGKGEVTKDSSSHRKGRLELKRVSSEGKTLDHDEPVKEAPGYGYSRAKTHKSATSSAASILDSLALTMVSTTPDEQSQVFMVLGEDVSKSVLPEGLPKDKELAMMYALQNCHTAQELIKCLVSYGVSTSSDQLQGFQVENKHLKECVDHLTAKNNTLAHSFQSAKLNMDEMYHTAEKIEANNVRLRHALKMAQQACEAFEVLLELRAGDSRTNPSNGSYFPSFDNSSLDSTLTRSPDREQVSMKHTATYRARSLLHNLDSNVELQSYLPLVRMRQGSGEYQPHTGHWPPGTLSQNTGTTSGLSSMSGGIEGEITQGEIDRLRQYSQALLHYKNHLVTTLVNIDGLKALDTVKKCEMVKDCSLSDASGSITDLEDAAHAEELCKVREEKAELRSQIYMMEQEKRRMELEVSRMLMHKQKCDRQMAELHFQLREEKRKRKKERKGRKGESSIPPHEPNHMSELSIEYTSALEREKEISERYEDLFHFLQSHVKDSQETTEELMRFVKELRRANSALVDAFEKSKKRQQAEKKRMKQELVSYMNRIQAPPAHLTDEPPPVGPVHT